MSNVVASAVVTGHADFDQLMKGMTQLHAKMDQLSRDNATVQRSTAGASSSLSGLTGAAQQLGVAISVVGLLKLGQEAVMLAAGAQEAQVTLEGLTGSSSQATAMMEAMRRATNYTVSELEAYRTASRLVALGLAETAEEAEKFAFSAATLGKAFRGLDPANSIALFNQMLSNRSVKLLDDFGIGIKEVNDRMKEMGDTSHESFQIAVMDLANQKALELAGVWDTAGASFQRLGASVKDVGMTIGEIFIPVLTDAVDSAWMLIQILQKAPVVVDQMKGDIAASTGSFREYMDALLEAGVITQATFNRFTRSEQGLATQGKLVEGLAEEWRLYQISIRNADRDQHEMRIGLQGTATELAELEPELLSSKEQLEAMAEAVLAGNASLEDFTQLEKDLKDPMQQVRDLIREEADALKEKEKAMKEAAKTQAAFTDIAKETVGQVTQLGTVFYQTTGENESAKELYGAITDEMESLSKKIQDAQVELMAFGSTWDQEKIDKAYVDIWEMEQAMGNLAVEAGNAQSAIGGVVQALTIDQVSSEDKAKIGEAFLSFLKATGNELTLQGDALLDYQVKMGLITAEQAKFTEQQGLLADALNTGRITAEQSADIFSGVLLGSITDINAAIDEMSLKNINLDVGDLSAMLEQDPSVWMNNYQGALNSSKEDVAESIQTTTDNLVASWTTVESTAYTAFGGVITKVDETTLAMQHLAAVIQEVSNAIAGMNMGVPTVPAGGGGRLTARAEGGPVNAGSPYLVGEKGPELFVPRRSGNITPNGGGGNVYVDQLVLPSVTNFNELEHWLKTRGKTLGS